MRDETRYSKGCLYSAIKSIIIIAATFLFSCKPEQSVKYEKPFIIIYESYGFYAAGTGKLYQYKCQDKNGNKFYSYSVKDIYNLGDSIK